MKTRWFQRWGCFHIPTSLPGFGLCALAAGFYLTAFRAVDRRSHSVSDTVYGGFPFFVWTFLLLDWVGSRTAGKAAHSNKDKLS